MAAFGVFSRAQAIGAGAFVIIGSLAGLALAAQSGLPQETLADCQLIPDDVARLACFDRVMKSGNTAMPQPGAQASAAPRQPTPEEIRAAQEKSYGLPRSQREDLDALGDVDEITVSVASTGLSADGNKLRIITTDGAVWDQVDGDNAQPPRPGSQVTITKGAMGSHFCKISNWQSVRCKRIQ